MNQKPIQPAHRPIKPFMELDEKGKGQKQRTDNLVNMLQDYREKQTPELSLNQLLGYILFRENRQQNKTVADIGWQMYQNEVDTEHQSFTIPDAIALKHNLTLSRDQIRKIRYVLQKRKIHFPTTNELNEARKKLRPSVFSVLEGKRVKVSYEELICKTTESVIQTCIEKGTFERSEGDEYKMFFKDGCDGAGKQTRIKKKKG